MEPDTGLMHEKDVLRGVDIGMTAKTAHPATEPGTLPVPGFRVSALETALAGVRGRDGHDRLAQRLGLVGQAEKEDMERPTADFAVEPSASTFPPDPAQILEREHVHPSYLCDTPADHMTHVATEPHFPARHGAQTPLGGLGAFCLQRALVVVVTPLRGSHTRVLFDVGSGGEIPDSEIDAQPSARDLGRWLHLVVELEAESIAPVVLQRGGFASPVLDDIPEMLGDAQNHRVRSRTVSISTVKHDPESSADTGQGQEIAAHGERAQVISDIEGVFRRRFPFTLVAPVASLGRLEGTISRRLEDGGRNLWTGFADTVIESIMGFLLVVCPVLSCPSGVFVEYLDAGLEHR